MKKLFVLAILALGLSWPALSLAQVLDDHTAREETEGKAVWEKLQAQQTTCADLADPDFAVLGEYFMGQMLGAAHEAMNNMMVAMMGQPGEEQMHIVMGQRLSGCDPAAAFPSQGTGFMPMMQMLAPYQSGAFGSGMMDGGANPTSMMNFGLTPWGGFGWIFMILWWVLIIAGLIAIIKWLTYGSRDRGDAALEVLKTRYAKGEINKKEFERLKKDLNS